MPVHPPPPTPGRFFGPAFFGPRFFGPAYWPGTPGTTPTTPGLFFGPGFWGARFFGPSYWPGVGPGPTPPGGDITLYGGDSFLIADTNDPFSDGETGLLR